MALKYFLFILSFNIFFNSAFAQKVDAEILLSLEESASIDLFLKTLFRETEAGYVFLNQKPLCIYGFHVKESFAIDHPTHKHSVALREGARVWRKIQKYLLNDSIIIHTCEKEDQFVPGHRHILIINIPLFHKVVNENLPLFQLVLGPFITSEILLKALVEQDHPFHSFLNNDKVLIGILLGYGTQNSLYVSRIENLQEASEEVHAPFLYNTMFSRLDELEFLPLKPSISYNSTDEEMKDLSNIITMPCDKLLYEKPCFGFGFIKGLKTENKFISELEQTQTSIQALLNSPLFLEETLMKIFNVKFKFPSNTEAYKFPLDSQHQELIFAKGIWSVFQHLDCFSDFLDGLNGVESSINIANKKAWFPFFLSEFLKAKENLKEANRVFCNLHSDLQLECLIPGKLYCKIHKIGNDQIPLTNSLAYLTYSIFSPNGHCLSKETKVLVNLNNTIPGFRIGVLGMKIDEIRELWIHPTLAYDYNVPQEKCIYLKALVTLENVSDELKTKIESFLEKHSKPNFTIFEPNSKINSIPDSLTMNQDHQFIDLNFVSDPAIEKNIREECATVSSKRGFNIRGVLQQYPIHIPKIVELLKQYHEKKANVQPLTHVEEEFINKFFWNHYFSY